MTSADGSSEGSARRRRTIIVATAAAVGVTALVALVLLGAAPVAPVAEVVPATRAVTAPAPSTRVPASSSTMQLPSTPAPATVEPSTATGGFEFAIGPVDEATRAKMGKTWFPGCPVPIEDLRHVTVTHFGFDGAVHQGEIVVAADAAESLRTPFHRLFEQRYPIQVLNVTDGEDVPWDESAAFNCRKKVGDRSQWSEHSYGRALDVNPVQNPYVSSSTIVPDDGRPYADRSRTDAGVLHEGDPVVTAFEAAGWHWGGTWTGRTHDYMHFSTTGQ